MGYVLCQENDLLAKHISEKIRKTILPFFDKFSETSMICKFNKDLNKFSNFGNEIDNLLLLSSFYNYDKQTFLPLINSRIEKYQLEYSKVANNPDLSASFKDRLTYHTNLLEKFTDNEKFEEEVKRLNEFKNQNLKKL